MKGLILKDFINLKKNFRIFGVLSLLYIVLAFTSRDSGFFSSVITMLFAILVLSLFSYDDMAKWDVYALTMPVSKDSIVRSKYIMLLILTLIGTVFSGVVAIGLNAALGLEDIFYSLPNSLIGALIVIILYSILLPFLIKLGVEKARIIFFIIMIVPFVTVSVLNNLIKEEHPIMSVSLVKFSEFVAQYYYILLPAIAFSALYLSYRISIGIYRKKEF